MRITHILFMRATISHATRPLVALALAVVLFGGRSAGEQPPIRVSVGQADAITGRADVIDGDTLAIDGVRIRLEGIDAPESGQTCGRSQAGTWACGAGSAGALSRLIEGKAIRCEQRGMDKYGRTLGVCFLGELDLSAWMVRQGHAWAFVKYSASYVKEEAEARSGKLGIWEGEAMPAWEYRAQRWASVEEKAPDGCAIKGNITARGKIYHMPWSPWYAQIRMDLERGRRWFCSEAEAVAAGWRPVNVN
jgi:endonuclease YncB( thermonuclease family)